MLLLKWERTKKKRKKKSILEITIIWLWFLLVLYLSCFFLPIQISDYVFEGWKKWEFIEPENLLKNPLKNVEKKIGPRYQSCFKEKKEKKTEFTSRSQLQWNKESLWPLSMQLWDFFFFIYFKFVLFCCLSF